MDVKIQFAVYAIDGFGSPGESYYGLKQLLDTEEEAIEWGHKDLHENPTIGRYTGKKVQNDSRVVFRVIVIGKEIFKSHGSRVQCSQECYK